jgi:hypothetical protein
LKGKLKCYQQSPIPVDVLRVGDPVQEISHPEDSLFSNGHELILKEMTTKILEPTS